MQPFAKSSPVLLLALLAASACNVQKDRSALEQHLAKKEPAWGPPLFKPAPEIDGQDTEGNPLRLSDQKGKVVLLSFWAHF